MSCLKGSEISSVILDLRNCGFVVARSVKVEASGVEYLLPSCYIIMRTYSVIIMFIAK